MTMVGKTLSILVFIAATAVSSLTATVTAKAESPDPWTVVAFSGAPIINSSDMYFHLQTVSTSASSLEIGDRLQPGTWIVTPAESRVLLVRGSDTIDVAPNSRVGLPAERPTDTSTTILHTLGSLLINVEKKIHAPFEVDTPFLTVVVKGTTFRVSINEFGAQVSVIEGVVQVQEKAGSTVAMVRAGQTATVSSEDLPGITISNSEDGKSEPSGSGSGSSGSGNGGSGGSGSGGSEDGSSGSAGSENGNSGTTTVAMLLVALIAGIGITILGIGLFRAIIFIAFGSVGTPARSARTTPTPAIHN